MLRLQLEDKEANSLIPLFAGFCFFLSSLELMIPKPIPFFRMGLANLPILISINFFSFPSFILLLIIKILGQALITGTMFSYITVFSAISSLSSGIVMYSLRNISDKHISFIGISVAGAFISNSFQLVLAIFMIFGRSALFIIPPMFFIGMITSILLGIFANKFTRNSIWFKNISNNQFKFKNKNIINNIQINSKENAFRIFSGILLFGLLLFTNYLPIKALILGAALILCIVDQQKINFVNLIVMFLSIIIFNLFPPVGKIIFHIGRFSITNQALLIGIRKAIILESMIYISKWILKINLNLKSNIGKSIYMSLFIFQKLATVKKEIKIKNIIPHLDAILLSINKL